MRNLIVSIVTGLVLLGVCWCGAAESKPAGKSVVASGAKVVKLPGKYRFTEGPAVDAKGNVFFTDIPKNLIYKLSVDGKLSVWREDSGGANGLFFDRKGNLLACEGNRGRVTSATPKGKVTVLAGKYGGKRFNKPNDLWVDPAGGVYFTDPVYGRFKVTQGGEHVYYLSPDCKKVTRVIDDMKRPNGIVGTPDGKVLYVADHGAGKVYRYKSHEIGLPRIDRKLSLTSDAIVVNVRREDRPKEDPPYVVSGRPVNLKQLRKIIKDAVKKHADQFVMVRGATNALHGNVASAVAACRDGGVGKANIRYEVREPKIVFLSEKKLFARVACDGMTVDNEGNVYLTERVVIVYSAAGKEIERIDTPMRPTNVCFGGADMKTLVITGAGAVCTVKMRVKGAGAKSP
ncbi:MAG: SMP-30/gluconolactonase/LRE family protein [Phycisphaerae bacterium]|jgi:sugar lactone lactonase YvrE|nr:SMP-30/gluconolactonase/LRE family protein [Phycisphaerae bacterium]